MLVILSDEIRTLTGIHSVSDLDRSLAIAVCTLSNKKRHALVRQVLLKHMNGARTAFRVGLISSSLYRIVGGTGFRDNTKSEKRCTLVRIFHALSSQERDGKAKRKLNLTIGRGVGSADVHSTLDCEPHGVGDEGCRVVKLILIDDVVAMGSHRNLSASVARRR
jgi:hypothetical protein